MKELIQILLDWLKKRPIGQESLLIIGVLAILYSTFDYLFKNPAATNILHDYRLQSASVAIISLWVASLCWRYAKYQFLRVLATATFVIIGISGVTWLVAQHRIEQWTIRIVFDESVTISPNEFTKIVNILQSPLFSVEICDKPITILTAHQGKITDEEAREALNAIAHENNHKNENKLFTMLVTGKNLSNSEWDNLLLITWSKSSVVSIWGVGQTNDISVCSVRKYIATSAILEALVARALSYKKTILDKRDPTIYKGCMHDFHRNRQTYISQCQNPKFCDLEANEIKKLFGEATLETANLLFSRISKDY